MQTTIYDFFVCMKSEIFPTEWKMVDVIPIYKRDDKQSIKNHRPVSYLPIFGKISKRQ